MSSINVTLAHAISYLTRPLIVSYSATTIIKLQLVLETNLSALYAPSWVPKDPLRGSGRRCLTLSPNCLPPRAIYAACLTAGIQWFDWIALLGGREFDLFVDPGCVHVRFAKNATPDSHLIVWSAQPTIAPTLDESKIQAQFKLQVDARAKAQRKTLAQQLLEEDEEDEEQLFAMIADQVSAPTWMTPILDQFPIPIRSSPPLSIISSHSRSSSRSSDSSSGFSFDSFASNTTFSTLSSSSCKGPLEPKQSRREKARQARVFVDSNKKEVTPYDGGKTTVLTGGVMLGGAPKPMRQPSSNWRSSIRA